MAAQQPCLDRLSRLAISGTATTQTNQALGVGLAVAWLLIVIPIEVFNIGTRACYRLLAAARPVDRLNDLA